MPAEATAREAVRSDLAAAAAAIANPEAFGFVVREEDSGSILLCLRGTQTPREWFRNFTAVPNPFTLVPGFGLVHLGFELMHRSVRNSIVNGLVAVAPDTRITIVAHSLGAAMGTLAAVDLKRNFGRTNVDICTFGGPRVGKVSFRRNFNREVPRCFRVTNLGDVVPHVPSLVTLWNHVGEEIEVDGAMENAHSLDAYLAGLRSIGTVREISPIGEMTALAAAVVSLRVP
jgi:triacylglycerol lipase